MNTNILEDQTHTKLVWLSYILNITVVLAPIGLIINFIKWREYKRLIKQSDHKQAEALEFVSSHHHWLMVSTIATLIFGMVAIGTAYYAVGLVIGAVIVFWWIYRMMRGVIMLAEGKPMPMLDNLHESAV